MIKQLEDAKGIRNNSQQTFRMVDDRIETYKNRLDESRVKFDKMQLPEMLHVSLTERVPKTREDCSLPTKHYYPGYFRLSFYRLYFLFSFENWSPGRSKDESIARKESQLQKLKGLVTQLRHLPLFPSLIKLSHEKNGIFESNSEVKSRNQIRLKTGQRMALILSVS